ncbi:VCBS repeat-containing protein [Streptomyces sp. ISL-36]|uniref:FG-GAP repeat domain-containing protein n=1 Tax=Streptomyces sp. ISL-36 TaxID=2819182 RepID=UPI001BEA4F71|nr:VCBS repeat-containing protein [Streptomyces sp. ISL-36]MBT2443251.1 VCBS repeat-containing protein [Streptomyces sp. ISL-36]
MPPAHSTRRRLAAAIATVLAVTLGSGALSVPATAAPVTADAAVTTDTAAAAEDVITLADGRSAPRLVATAGEPAEVTLVRHTVPSVIDLSNKSFVSMDWELSQDGWATVVLRHTRTGITTKHLLGSAGHPRTFSLAWDAHDVVTGDAPNGDYTWTITAESVDGVPFDFTASGSFTVVRKTAPHDFNDNGSLDVLERDPWGGLWRVDTSSYDGSLSLASRLQIGWGWQAYDRIEATGDLGGTPVGDLLARDKSGVLWLYQGNGRGGFATRIKVGTGWQIYDRIAAGSDLTNDSRADVIATDKYGGLWLYPGTGNAGAPFSARKKIGTGWGVYNELTAVGNIAGGAAGDLVARDKYGVLWQYLGKGDGTFAPRTKIGGGWNAYTHLVGVGDVTKDGRADLLGFGADSEYLYRATGDWRAPFAPVQQALLHYPDHAYDHIA